MEEKNDVEGLIRASQTEKDYEIRARAAGALGNIGDPRAVEPLSKGLKDTYYPVRVEVANALGKIRDPRVVEPLLGALTDQDINVKEKAWDALQKSCDARDINSLIEALHNSETRDYAARILGKIGKPAVESLIRALENNEYFVRVSVIEQLGRIGDERAVDPLIELLRDQDLMTLAVEALGRIGDERAVDPLVKLYEEGHSPKEIVGALESIGDERSMDLFIKILEDTGEEKEMRESAARVLSGYDDKTVIELFIETLKDCDLYSQVPEIAMEALTNIGKPAVEPLLKAFEDKKPEYSNPFSTTEGYEKSTQLARIATVLGKIRDKRAIEVLSQALKAENRVVKIAVKEALEKF
ncbi:MAG: HEAT repeat domain-containing protein [Candidatus Bathyarchaeota archaeon]|nr:HEAT repeat domain-containing protein [Candidatus Bathyarchaeota archaeon]